MYYRNILIHLSLILVSGSIPTYILLFLMLEILEYRFNIKIWSQQERTSNCYDWFEHYLPQNYDKDLNKDYSESLFDGNSGLTIEAATLRKFDYIFRELNLSEGQTLLDCGCGTGVWMLYCKGRGVNVVGLTLSKEQAQIVKSKGLDARVQDYREYLPSFQSYFDAISLIGSTEHTCLSQGALTGDSTCCDRCIADRIKLFKMLKGYLKTNGKMFISGLVKNSKRTPAYTDMFYNYILERHYGGYYSYYEDYIKALEASGLHIISSKDTTKDYFWTSVRCPDHFGYFCINMKQNVADKIIYFVKGLFTDPFLWHHFIYHISNAWMWQFGGYKKQYLTDEDVQRSPMHNKYFTLGAHGDSGTLRRS